MLIIIIIIIITIFIEWRKRGPPIPPLLKYPISFHYVLIFLPVSNLMVLLTLLLMFLI